MTFLERVTSRAGMNVIVGIRPRVDASGNPVLTKNGKQVLDWIHRFVQFSDHVSTQRAIADMATLAGDVYFGLGAFKQDDKGGYNRQASNVVALRSLWIDIDCGEKKWIKHNGVGVYKSQQDGLRALGAWLKVTNFPVPTLFVSSGTGLHIYWELDRDVPKDEFREYAAIFKGLLRRFNLHADPSRTGEVSSVLRPVGTVHISSGNTVSILKDTGQIHNWELMKNQLESLKIHLQDPTYQIELARAKGYNSALGEVPEWLKGDTEETSMEINTQPRSFEVIMRKQEFEGTGCKQLWDMYQDQNSVPEPMWAGGLSIIKFCVDKDEWAVKFSENYEGFDKDETFKKMEQFKGPRTCAWFNSQNPGVCDQCPHFRQVLQKPNQSPLMLGVQDNRVPTVVTAPIAVATPTGMQQSTIEETFVIPAYPFPYFRNPQGGGIYRQPDADNGETEPTCIFPYDLYLYDRIGEGSDGIPRLWARFHSPRDGVMEMELTPDVIYAEGSSMMTKLANHHIYLTSKEQAKNMGQYLRHQLSDLQAAKAMNQAPKQLGWTDRGTFVLGRTEYTPAGPRMCPANESVIATMFAKACERVKDYDYRVQTWREIVSGLYGAKDAGIYRLILASGFGTVLRSRYALEKGGIINLFSEDSGFGKTTLTKVVASIFGDPEPFVLQAKHGATNVAFFETLSYLNSLPLVVDETGQMPVHDLMEFIHTCTSGKAKLRGSAQVNDVRATLPGWRTFVYSSSNVSIWNKVSEARLENEAYIMRVVELPIKALEQSLDKTYGDSLVKRLPEVKGVCAPILLDYVVKHDAEMRKLWDDMNTYLSRTADMHSRYRFWVDILTSAAVGARVGYDLGLFPFDPDVVRDNCVRLLVWLKKKATGKVLADTDILSEFFTHNLEQTVTVATPDSFAPFNMPRSKVGIRVERWHNIVYISYSAIQNFAKERGFDRYRLEKIIEDLGGVRTAVNMLANTNLDTLKSNTGCWKLNMDADVVLNRLQKGEGNAATT